MPEVIVRKGEPIDRLLPETSQVQTRRGGESWTKSGRLRAFSNAYAKIERKAKANAKCAKAKFRFSPQ